MIFIQILYPIQKHNEEQRLQRIALQDDEGKEDCSCTTDYSEAYYSETYHAANHRPAALRLISHLSYKTTIRYILYFFLTHFWIFRLISRLPNRVKFDG